MNFATVKGVTIPEGNVKSIAINGQQVWSAKQLTWDAVFASIDAGTYATDYAIGDCIPLDLGSEGVVNMQIAGFDVDDLSDGSGKAHISFVAKELLKTEKRMNPSLVTNADGTHQEGTGTIGGWESCELRKYLKETVLPMIPEEVRSRIVTVAKTQNAFNQDESDFTQASEEDVWIPSENEVSGASSLYKALFENANTNRIKAKAGSTSASKWWLRSAHSITSIRYVDTSGSVKNYNGYSSLGVALGFCI